MAPQIKYKRIEDGDMNLKPVSTRGAWCGSTTIGRRALILIVTAICCIAGSLGFAIGIRLSDQTEAESLWLCEYQAPPVGSPSDYCKKAFGMTNNSNNLDSSASRSTEHYL